MGILKPYIDKLEATANELDNVAIQAVRDNEAFILRLLKDEQLGKGMDSLGKDILHPKGSADGTYMPKTENYWAKKRPFPRTPKITGRKFDMEWTGTFKDSMEFKYDKEGFDILSSTKIAMEAVYGTKLTALNTKNLKTVGEKIITPALYSHIFSNFIP